MRWSGLTALAKYSTYSPSGLDWLTVKPAHWKVTRAKAIFGESANAALGSEGLPWLSVSQYSGVTFRHVESNGHSDTLEGRVVDRGELVINTMLAWNGSLGISPVKGKVSPAYSVYQLLRGEGLYFQWLLKTPAALSRIKQSSRGIVDSRLRLYPEQFLTIKLLEPPIDEQKAIVEFLGHWTNRIDTYIAQQGRMIELLEEERRAIITQAVTRGLDPDAKMKHSGVEWIGEIPDHWDILRGKDLFTKEARPVREEDDIVTCFRDGQVTLRKNRRETGFTHAEVEAGYQGVRVGDLVIHAMDAFAGAVGVADSDGKVSPVCAVCSPKQEAYAPYYALAVREMGLKGWLSAIAKGIRERSTDFRFAAFSNSQLPYPPFSEQKAIVDALQRHGDKTDQAITTARKEIELLKEYRARLITDAVTGQIDVREAAKELERNS